MECECSGLRHARTPSSQDVVLTSSAADVVQYALLGNIQTSANVVGNERRVGAWFWQLFRVPSASNRLRQATHDSVVTRN